MNAFPHPRFQAGVTLVEMIVAIVVLGVLVAITSMFVRTQIESYLDVARRAELADVADASMRRVMRELQSALPNSPRTPTAACVEFIPTKTGGRYRSESTGSAGSDELRFDAADTSFNMYGPLSTLASQQIQAGDLVAVYNLGITGADAFNQDNTSRVSAAPVWNASAQETAISIDSKLFPLPSPNGRFQVIPGGEQVVAFVCAGVGVSASGDGTGTLFRYARSLPYPAPVACPIPPVATPAMLTNVSNCSFSYSPGVGQRNGLVTVTLETRRAGETVRLSYQVNVANTP